MLKPSGYIVVEFSEGGHKSLAENGCTTSASSVHVTVLHTRYCLETN